MDLPLPPVAERFERLEETLRLALQMWSGDASPFHGRHYRLERPVGVPAADLAAAPADPHRRHGGEARRFGWSRSTATPATCSTSPTAAPRSGTSSRCSSATATRSAARTSRSRRRSAPASSPARRRTRSRSAVGQLAELGIEHARGDHQRPMERRPGRRRWWRPRPPCEERRPQFAARGAITSDVAAGREIRARQPERLDLSGLEARPVRMAHSLVPSVFSSLAEALGKSNTGRRSRGCGSSAPR